MLNAQRLEQLTVDLQQAKIQLLRAQSALDSTVDPSGLHRLTCGEAARQCNAAAVGLAAVIALVASPVPVYPGREGAGS